MDRAVDKRPSENASVYVCLHLLYSDRSALQRSLTPQIHSLMYIHMFFNVKISTHVHACKSRPPFTTPPCGVRLCDGSPDRQQ